jgi:hypothetical protein
MSGNGYTKLIRGVGLILLVSIGLFPVKILAANLLTNSGFNNPFNDIPGRVWQGQNEQIASGWTPFYIPGNTYDGDDDASKLRWMSSAQFAAAFGGIDYKIEGNQAQNMWSSYEFDGGVYQQISGVTPGQVYGFDIGIVTFWRGPGYPDSNGVMFRQVGIDPTGGTDPTSNNIIWSETNADDKAWVYMDVAATAQASTITVFAKVQAPENSSFNHTDLDIVYFDAAHIDLAPTATLDASHTGATIQANWSGSTAPGWSIKGYEVQYKEQNASSWVTLQTKNQTATNGAFTGLAGRVYTLRVRPWQTKAESYHSDIDIPGIWVEKEVTIDDVVIGKVFDHKEIGLNGVTISLDGTATSVLSTGGGNYALFTGGAGTFNIVAQDYDGLVAPPPIAVTIPANGVGLVNLTLRPDGAAQGITNNDFDINLDSWTISSAGAAISTTDYHSGQGSLWITGNVEVSQTNLVTGMDRPLLSFWYKSDTTLSVEFLADSGAVRSQSLPPVADWTYARLSSGLGEAYSGLVGARFSYTGGAANIYIDEVSIGAGSYKNFLPIVIQN